MEKSTTLSAPLEGSSLPLEIYIYIQESHLESRPQILTTNMTYIQEHVLMYHPYFDELTSPSIKHLWHALTNLE